MALADQALVSGANFLAIIAVARCADAEEFGWFSLLWAARLFVSNLHVAMVLQPLAILVPELAEGPRAAYLAALERWHRVALIGMAAAVTALSGSTIVALSGIALASTGSRLGADFHRRLAYARGDSPGALLIDAAGFAPLAVVTLAGALRLVETSATVVLATAAATSLLGWAAGSWRNRSALSSVPEPIAPVARRHWQVGGWLLGGTLASWGANQLYPFLVAGMLGIEATGALAAARSLLGVAQPMLQGLDAYGTPRARSAFLLGGAPRLRRELSRFTIMLAVTVVPACIWAALAPLSVLHLVFGGRYDAAAVPLRWLAAQQLVIAGGYLLNLGLLAVRETRAGFLARVVACALTIVAGPLAIRWWGLSGACAAMLANSIMITAISALWLVNRMRVPAASSRTMQPCMEAS